MPIKVRNRHRLKNKEIISFNNELKNKFGSTFFSTNSSVEVGDLDEFRIIIVENEIDFMIVEKKIFFTLRGVYKFKPRKYSVVVDMGAIGFITKGADIMAPGITDADSGIEKNDFVYICDEMHQKPLAIGIALMTGEEMKSKNKGKAIKNIHYIGDKLWNLTK